MTSDPNTRKSQERARKRAAGLVRLELWLPPALHEQVRKYVERMKKKSNIA